MSYKGTSTPCFIRFTTFMPKRNPQIYNLQKDCSEVAQQIDFDDMSLPLRKTQSAIFLHRVLAWRKVRMAAAR